MDKANRCFASWAFISRKGVFKQYDMLTAFHEAQAITFGGCDLLYIKWACIYLDSKSWTQLRLVLILSVYSACVNIFVLPIRMNAEPWCVDCLMVLSASWFLIGYFSGEMICRKLWTPLEFPAEPNMVNLHCSELLSPDVSWVFLIFIRAGFLVSFVLPLLHYIFFAAPGGVRGRTIRSCIGWYILQFIQVWWDS